MSDDDIEGMPGLEDMPALADGPAEAKRPAGGGGGSRARPPPVMDPNVLMSPAAMAQMRQQMDPATLKLMQASMQKMDPAMIQKMRASMQQMTPQQRQAMQASMQTMAQQLPPGEFAQIQDMAKRNAQALLQAKHGGAMQVEMPTAAVPIKPEEAGGHGHSHGGGGSHGHSHGGGRGGGGMSYASLMQRDAGAVMKAARAELGRPFIPKTHIVYECPRCSYEAPATYPMVVHTARCNKCGQFISLPAIDPLPRERSILAPAQAGPLPLDGVRRGTVNPSLFQYIELGEFIGFDEALRAGARPDIRMPTGDQPTLLHWATVKFRGDLRFLELLLRHPDTEVDAVTVTHKQTPLMLAAYHGTTSVVQLLLAGKANMHLVDESNWTVLHQAAKSGNTFLVDLFHRGGVSLHAKDKQGRTALHWAAYHNRTDTITWLLERGLNIMERDVEQCIPLHWAALKGHLPAIDLLLRFSHTQEQLAAEDETGEDAAGLAADKELRVEDPNQKQLYLMVSKTIRQFGSELGWRRRLFLLSGKPGTGMPLIQGSGPRAAIVVFEFASVGYVYFKHVFWLTSHLTLVTIAFTLLLLATGLLWVHLRRMDPGYVTRPAPNSSSNGDDGGGGGGGSADSSAPSALAREIVPSLPAQFGVLKRHYTDSLRCVPRAYGKVDPREGIVVPVRARRCDGVDRIVLHYHGFCPWLGVPVGLRNTRVVLAFTVLVVLLVTTWVALGWYYADHLTPVGESVFTAHSGYVLWLAHFLFYAYTAVRNGSMLAHAAAVNATSHELNFPAANPHMLVRSQQAGVAWHNPFTRGPRTNFLRFLSGADVLDVPLPPLSCSAPPAASSAADVTVEVASSSGGPVEQAETGQPQTV